MFVNMKDVKSDDVLIADNGFTCVKPGPVKICEDEHGLFFSCECGKHYIDGQLDFDGSDQLVGLSRL
jgi:hypothetical protein